MTGNITIRSLTPPERARLKEALTKLHAPHQHGEPLEVDAFEAYRLRRLRDEYPDVAELIGCDP